jgi:hypothetical protein
MTLGEYTFGRSARHTTRVSLGRGRSYLEWSLLVDRWLKSVVESMRRFPAREDNGGAKGDES